MNEIEEIIALHKRRQFFANNFAAIEIAHSNPNNDEQLKNSCPSCGYLTLGSRWSWEICTICFWEDDGQDDAEAEEVWGGPNGIDSLAQYRMQTAKFLAELKKHSAGTNSAGAIAGQEVNKLDLMIEAYQPQEEELLMEQMQAVEKAFAKVRGLI